MNLPNGTLLQGGKYRIERVLGQGGFGITYLATQVMLDRQVAVKEFFFRDFNLRDGDTKTVTIATEASRELVERYRKKFVKEAQTISRLDHAGIVRIYDIFAENATAYYVMEYLEGESLSQLVERRGAIPEAEAVGYVSAVGDALQYIHAMHINHLDIKPGNIIRRRDGRVVLIDFGVSKQYDATTDQGTTTTPVGISHGYSPAEQYRQGGVQQFSPQSDVYALAATLFKLLTGVTPPDAMTVIDEGLPLAELQSRHVAQSVIDAIAAAMRSRSHRTSSVAQFIAQLTRSPQPVPPAIPPPIPTTGDVTIVQTRPVIEQKPVLQDRTFNVGGVTFKMIAVEGGTFMMGATAEQGNMAEDNEKPAHQVTLSSFMIGETQVTQALWMAVMGSNPSDFTGNNQRPVENVSWYDCQDFIRKLNAMTGEHFRLPTEAEWEFAAHGGNRSQGYKFAGSNNVVEVAWYDYNSYLLGSSHPDYGTHAVATKAPNELGLYDMSGNVWEWCQDWYGSYSSDAQTNPTGPASGSYRVNRGGCWDSRARFCRVSFRCYYAPSYGLSILGLRLAL